MNTIQQSSQRELELELVRVRAEARAARLEAQAAELELMLRRMVPDTQDPLLQRHEAHPAIPSPIGLQSFASQPSVASSIHGPWDHRLQHMQVRRQPVDAPENGVSNSGSAINWSTGSVDLARLRSAIQTAAEQVASKPLAISARMEAPLASATSQAPTRASIPQTPDAPASPGLLAKPLEQLQLRMDDAHAASPSKQAPADHTAVPPIKSPSVEISRVRKASEKPVAAPELSEVAAATATLQGADEDEQPTRWRPASWMLSTVAHVVVLVILASMSLAVSPPKDQLAFSGSAGDSSEEVIESFQIETSEPMQPSEPEVAETAYDVSDFGTMPVTEVNVDVPPEMVTPDSEMFSELSSSSATSSAMMKTLKGDAGPKSQFCGVDGGGNHFVYLVDSSNSMGSGFQSARAELLASIDQLKPDQRFYVVFFDEQPDFMRISDPDVDEDASVMATPENKKRLREWAMNVEMNKGKAPYDVLPFVLKLRPDVIFLLSDGEFPEKIGQILREQNRQENLFGDSGPISIVHTIRYHGREGEEGRRAETTMVAIAKENSGQYRHVPKPKTK